MWRRWRQALGDSMAQGETGAGCMCCGPTRVRFSGVVGLDIAYRELERLR